MENSVERIKYLTEYIQNYEKKIKSLNKLGLFDEAKMFELFAIETCRLYFSCDFSNLNYEKNNYPCVDLISTTNNMYVQVSTCENVPSKIKNTLMDIKSSKDEKIKNIKKIYFFVLNNESIKNVKSYLGKNKIGIIDFDKNENLITTEKILRKAENDLNFQQKLYEICKKDEHEYDYKKFNEAISISKLYIKDITDTIGGEYKINIEKQVREIENDTNNFILVTGQAGIGKSVLCKHVVCKNKNFLYTKAERIMELNDIDQIWKCNVSNMLEFISHDFYIFIDSLEFIADNKAKLDLLNYLFSRLANHKNIKVICSCRESDRSSFIKLENDYNFSVHTVNSISNSEIINIACKFPIIKDMLHDDRYRDLLSIPFYLNCLTKIKDITNVKNEDDLRNLIWEKMICIENKENELIITDIVLDRAKNFLLGSDMSKYDISKINKLVSGNSLIEHNGMVRLKYDIFEDICFERYIDSLFDCCKGDYSIFFLNLSKLGRCIYRRLQIWIENKLFVKSNRDKFLYALLNSSTISAEWKKQIEIGIVKSRHSFDFLVENSERLLNDNYINELVKLVNLYGFEIDKVSTKNSSMQLKPIGSGRSALIKIIFEKDIYKTEIIARKYISKLISDISRDENLTTDIAIQSCKIIQYLVDEDMLDSTLGFLKKYTLCKTDIKSLLNMSNYCSNWLREYINALIDCLTSKNTSRINYASDSISDLICADNGKLVSSNYDDVLKLFSNYFTYDLEEDYFMHNGQRDLDDEWKYGLNKNAKSYMQNYRDYPASYSTCFRSLLNNNYWNTLDWFVLFLNEIANKYDSNEKLNHYDIFFVDDNIHKRYIGNEKMWLASFQEYQVPTIIGDLIFTFEKFTENIVTVLNSNEKKLFLDKVKNIIFEKSNNIFLISSILYLGLKNASNVPGYAVDLATCLDIVLMDCSRYTHTLKNPAKEVLKEEIIKTTGLPSLGMQRYKDNNIEKDLRMYIVENQLNDNVAAKKCKKILSYLYATTKNDSKNALYYLQIEYMDLEKNSISQIGENSYLITTNFSGEALKFSKKNDNYYESIDDIRKIFSHTKGKLENNILPILEAEKAALNLIEYVNHPYFSAVSNFAFSLLAYCLGKDELSLNKRNDLCNIWLQLLLKKKENASIIVDCDYYMILFE